ncbi:hypothetical protein BC835DRAFT_1309606 [Cytidiella melzeri]|nr:hypothetical protein BC835DRAFT_1309606 [Cytidiella melzeri]
MDQESWKQQERDALTMRGEHLRIFEVSMDKAPTQTDLKNQLMEKTNRIEQILSLHGLMTPSDYSKSSKHIHIHAWEKRRLEKGFLIQSQVDKLRKEDIKLSANIAKCMAEAQQVIPTEHWTKIQEMLQLPVHNMCYVFEGDIPDADNQLLSDAESSSASSDAEDEAAQRSSTEDTGHRGVFASDWEDLEDDDDDDDELDDDGDLSAVADRLFLPSLIGVNACKGLQLQKWAKYELSLREGQANDALERLRDGLAYKALIYRAQLPHATSSTGRTRLWGNIKLVQDKINKAVLSYRIARTALVQLASDKLSLYEELKDKHLTVNKDITEEIE